MRGFSEQSGHRVVLGWPLMTPIPILAYPAKKTRPRADRTQILLLLKQTLIDFCRRLITIGGTVQRLKHCGLLLRTQRARLHRLFPRAPWGGVMVSTLLADVYRASVEAQGLACASPR